MSHGARVVAVVVVILALCAALAVGLARSEPRYAGVNSVRSSIVATEIGADDEVCQVRDTVPAGTAAIEVLGATGGRPGPPLQARVLTRTSEFVSTGRLAGGYGDGKIAIPVKEIDGTLAEARICIRNLGRGKLALLGAPTPPGLIEVNGEPRTGLLTIGFLRAGEETTLALLPTIAHRLGLAKTTLAGSWTIWALLALFLASSAIALRLVLARDFGEEAR
jgi:hypothetical protein